MVIENKERLRKYFCPIEKLMYTRAFANAGTIAGDSMRSSCLLKISDQLEQEMPGQGRKDSPKLIRWSSGGNKIYRGGGVIKFV